MKYPCKGKIKQADKSGKMINPNRQVQMVAMDVALELVELVCWASSQVESLTESQVRE